MGNSDTTVTARDRRNILTSRPRRKPRDGPKPIVLWPNVKTCERRETSENLAPGVCKVRALVFNAPGNAVRRACFGACLSRDFVRCCTAWCKVLDRLILMQYLAYAAYCVFVQCPANTDEADSPRATSWGFDPPSRHQSKSWFTDRTLVIKQSIDLWLFGWLFVVI